MTYRRLFKQKASKTKRTHLSFPLLGGSANDLLISVSHHGDQHVEKKNGNENGKRYEHSFRHSGQTGVLKRLVLTTRPANVSTINMFLCKASDTQATLSRPGHPARASCSCVADTRRDIEKHCIAMLFVADSRTVGSCVAKPGCPGTAQRKILFRFTYL